MLEYVEQRDTDTCNHTCDCAFFVDALTEDTHHQRREDGGCRQTEGERYRTGCKPWRIQAK